MTLCLLFDDSYRHFLFYADVLFNSCLFGVLFPVILVTSLSFFADAGRHAPRMQEKNEGIK